VPRRAGLISGVRRPIREVQLMIQQGQVFRLKARGAAGEPLWAYRYRVAGRGSARLQVGGFATRAEAQRALQNKLARLGPDGRAATITLAEWVEEYLQTHTGERVTIAKLRWLLGKATAALGEVALAELSPEAVCAWRLTVPEGHRYEATQALRQVLTRAVAWKLIEENPGQARGAESGAEVSRTAAVRVVGPDPDGRRGAGTRSWADGAVRRCDRASTLGAVRAEARRRRSAGRCRSDQAGVCERAGQADQDQAE
jgi:hypothetical protein